MIKLLILSSIILLFLIALKSKINLNKFRQKDLVESVSTPISQGITQLVGMAGGIYISLVLLTSFLSIETMEKVTIDGFTFDPLALLSILVALIQPIVQYLIKTRR
jgi:hypothetical protein